MYARVVRVPSYRFNYCKNGVLFTGNSKTLLSTSTLFYEHFGHTFSFDIILLLTRLIVNMTDSLVNATYGQSTKEYPCKKYLCYILGKLVKATELIVGSGDYSKRKTEAITAIAIHAHAPLNYLPFHCKRWLRKVYLNFIWYIHHGITVELTGLLK